MKKTIITFAVVIILVAGGIYYFINSSPKEVVEDTNQTVATTTNTTATTTATSTKPVDKTMTVIGKSVEGRDIVAYHFGTGATELLFVGGIHGGYEWNTVLVAYNLVDYLKANLGAIPANIKVTVIPVLNPDGLNKVVGTTTGNFSSQDVISGVKTPGFGRFNDNGVDLNRNFDCDWQTVGKWQNMDVNGGSAVFSEPESLAMKNYIGANNPKAVVVYYSAAGGVYSSSCHNGILPETNTLTKTYAKASGYPAYETFDFYATTGDMVNWLAKINIPAISVLLTNHNDVEWSKNLAGVQALLKYYGK